VPTHRNSYYLIGPMGSGKTAVGRQLARDLKLRFKDSDTEIERRTGVDIAYIFEKEGESGFRAREKEVIVSLTALDNVVVATGGGAILDPANRACLKANGTVIYLHTSVEEQLKRTARGVTRPLLMHEDPRAVLERLMTIRSPLYEEIADICIDTTGRQVAAVAAAVRQLLEERDLLPLKTDTSPATLPKWKE
jgi:shikimate kinase